MWTYVFIGILVTSFFSYRAAGRDPNPIAGESNLNIAIVFLMCVFTWPATIALFIYRKIFGSKS